MPRRSRVAGVLDWVSIEPRRGRYVSLDPEEHAMSILPPGLAGLALAAAPTTTSAGVIVHPTLTRGAVLNVGLPG